MKNNNYIELQENEIKEALKVLNTLIKNGNILYDEKHANPAHENCYISSGAVAGVYFPNSIITNIYNAEGEQVLADGQQVVCISKTPEGQVGMVLRFNDDLIFNTKNETLKNYYNNYFFESFESLLYTYEERRTIELLNNNIYAVKKDIELLNNIKFITKKDGGVFADLKKNLDPEPQKNIFINSNYDGKNIKIYYTNNKNNYSIHHDIIIYDVESVEALKIAIDEYKKEKNKYIEALEADLKNIKKIFKLVYNFKRDISKMASLTTRSILKNDINIFY